MTAGIVIALVVMLAVVDSARQREVRALEAELDRQTTISHHLAGDLAACCEQRDALLANEAQARTQKLVDHRMAEQLRLTAHSLYSAESRARMN